MKSRWERRETEGYYFDEVYRVLGYGVEYEDYQRCRLRTKPAAGVTFQQLQELAGVLNTEEIYVRTVNVNRSEASVYIVAENVDYPPIEDGWE